MLASEAKTLTLLNSLFRNLRFKTTQCPHLKRVVRRKETTQQQRQATKQSVQVKVKALFLPTRLNTWVHVVDTEVTFFGTTLHPGQHVFRRCSLQHDNGLDFFETTHNKSYYIERHQNTKSLETLSASPEMRFYKNNHVLCCFPLASSFPSVTHLKLNRRSLTAHQIAVYYSRHTMAINPRRLSRVNPFWL